MGRKIIFKLHRGRKFWSSRSLFQQQKLILDGLKYFLNYKIPFLFGIYLQTEVPNIWKNTMGLRNPDPDEKNAY